MPWSPPPADWSSDRVRNAARPGSNGFVEPAPGPFAGDLLHFYSLSAFFDDIDEAGLSSCFTQAVPTPKLRLADATTTAAVAQADAACVAAQAEASLAAKAAREAVAAWLAGAAPMPGALEAGGGTMPGALVHHAFEGRGEDGHFASEAGSRRPGTLAGAIRARQDAEGLGGYVAAALDAGTLAASRRLEHSRHVRDELAERPAEIMVMRELPQPKMAFILQRGDYDKRREPVEPDTPASLPPFPADQPRNRLGLARWLIDPDHPLLARVTVNPLWQSLIGLGLGPSTEGLGSQSMRPEHPQVLDLRAWQFSHPVADGGCGWDMKRLVKTIMRSQTCRQRSMADAKTMADDPLNVRLARGPRHRLPAEMIRDGALAACGLLVEQLGGPPVKTHDMPESFKPEQADRLVAVGGTPRKESLVAAAAGVINALTSFDGSAVQR